MMKFFLIILMFISTAYAKDNFSLYIVKYPRHQEIHFKGEVKTPFESKKKLYRTLEMLDTGKDTILVIKQSWGGVIASFRKALKIIQQKCSLDINGCELTVYVEKYCASACVDLLMGGDKRYMLFNAKLGFHRAWVIHPSIPIKSAKKMGLEYIEMGVDEQWMMQNLDIFVISKKTAFGYSAKWLELKDAIEANFISGWSAPDFVHRYRMDHL